MLQILFSFYIFLNIQKLTQKNKELRKRLSKNDHIFLRALFAVPALYLLRSLYLDLVRRWYGVGTAQTRTEPSLTLTSSLNDVTLTGFGNVIILHHV